MAEDRSLTKSLLEAATRLGFDTVGVCSADAPESLTQFQTWVERGMHGTMGYLERSVELRSDPSFLLPGVKSIVAVGLNYKQPNKHVPGHPRIATYALGRDYHKTIRSKLRKLQSRLEELAPDAVCRICVDSAPILEREYAHRAGLGWIGKNTCLIDSKRGSWFLIGLLLTTANLTPTPRADGGCGSCKLCIEACPTGAIVYCDERWQVDARNCISYLTIEHKGEFTPEQSSSIGSWTFGCDVCQEVCPFNQARPGQPLRSNNTIEPDFLNRRQWPDLVRLSVVSEAEWDEATKGSPVRRTGVSGLRRNAAANLVNDNPS